MMKKGCAIIAALSAVTVFGIMGYLWYFFSNSYEAQWRQKMVVEVNTPAGVKSGEAVLGVDFERGSGRIHADGSGVKWSITGEGVVVDLGQGKQLFALLKGDRHTGDAGVNASFVFANLKGVAAGERQAIEEVLALGGTPKPIPLKHYPMLVTFADINNPASVKLVDPRNLAATFGCPSSVAGQASEASASPQTDAAPEGPADDKPCYALKSITLEITDEPVTQGKVESVLGWLAELNGGYLHGGFTSKGSPLGLQGGDFKVGDSK